MESCKNENIHTKQKISLPLDTLVSEANGFERDNIPLLSGSHSYGHLLVITGYMRDHTFHKWCFVSTYNWYNSGHGPHMATCPTPRNRSGMAKRTSLKATGPDVLALVVWCIGLGIAPSDHVLTWILRPFGDDFPKINHDSSEGEQWGRDQIYPDIWEVPYMGFAPRWCIICIII